VRRQGLALFALLSACAGSNWPAASSLHAPAAAKYPDAPAVMLLDEHRWVLDALRRQPSTRQIVHRRVAILREPGLSTANVRIELLRGARLVRVTGRTVLPNGRVVWLASDDVVDDLWREDVPPHASFVLPEATVGAVLEYEIEVEWDGIVPMLVEPTVERLPVERYRAELLLSDAIVYAVRPYNTDVPFKRDRYRGMDRVSIDIKRPFVTRNAPWRLVSPWWAFRVKSLQYSRSSETYFPDWPSALKPTVALIDAVLAGASAVPNTRGCVDKTCRIERAVAMVRDKTTLSGFVNTPTARPLDDVLASGTANNYEKALLLLSALRALHVEAGIALVGRRGGVTFDRTFPLPNQFDHFIVQAGTQLIDPSCEACRPGELPSWSSGRVALTTDGNFIQTPPARESVYRRESQLRLDAIGDAQADISIEHDGTFALASTRTDPELHHLERQYRSRPAGATVRASAPRNCDRIAGRCAQSFSLAMPGYATPDGDSLVVPFTVLPAIPGVSDVWFMPLDNRREDVVTITLPPGWEADRLPRPMKLTSPALDAEITVESEPDRVVVRQVLHLRAGHWMPSKALDTALFELAALRRYGFLARPKLAR
jgi:hypothetical protein